MTEREVIELLVDSYPALADSVPPYPEYFEEFTTLKGLKDYVKNVAMEREGLDLLVVFVVTEVYELYEEDKSNADQCSILSTALDRAKNELGAIAMAFFSRSFSL